MEEDRIKAAMIDLLLQKAGSGFSEKVLEYGNHPINCGTMDHPEGYAKVTGPCGDTVEIFLRIRHDKIENVFYMTDGCMTSHAAVSAAIVLAMGRPVREGLRINQSAILKHLDGMPEDSQHCALLAAKTFQKALWNYVRGKKSR